jgi:putative ABC transport system permease protein
MIDTSISDYYKSANVSDFIVKSTSSTGFTQNDINILKQKYGEENVNAGMSFDVYITVDGQRQLTRLYFLDFDEWTINVPEIVAGNVAESVYDAYCDRADYNITSFDVGTQITLDFADIFAQLGSSSFSANLSRTVTICAQIDSPLTFANDGEPSYDNPEDLDVSKITSSDELITLQNILYLSYDIVPGMNEVLSFLGDTKLIPQGDVYITLQDRNVFNAFSSSYKKLVEEQVEKIEELFTDIDGNSTVRVITLYDNFSFVSVLGYSDKVLEVGILLMVAFLFVTVLVVLSNMTRLLEEERGQIACLSTLGYSPISIVFKYILFAALATGIGGFGAYFVGIALAQLLYVVFNYSFVMPPNTANLDVIFFLIVFAVVFVATVVATLWSGYKMTREKPANLLRPKPPRAGKKVIIERIPLIWNRLSFKYKSTVRNVLRYKNRFLMTVVAVAISTSLVMAGLGLLDVCLFGGLNSLSVMGIALVVIVFAGLLTVVIIYTLTNINISERNRELATLMVLGYYDNEVSGYIFREIVIDTVVGILFGYPLSAMLLWLVYDIMGRGSLATMSWFWWIVAPVIILAFTFIVSIILRRRIVRIEMNESLKAIE